MVDLSIVMLNYQRVYPIHRPRTRGMGTMALGSPIPMISASPREMLFSLVVLSKTPLKNDGLRTSWDDEIPN